MQLKNTKECIALIIRLYGDLAVQWKRTKKAKENGNIVRDFVNANGDLVKIVTTLNHDFIGIGLVNKTDDAALIAVLKKAAKTIKHCGDYGELWYQPTTKNVWWVAGDADGDPTGPTTPMSEIITKFVCAKAHNIGKVFVEAESYPDQAAGWVCLGKHGKVVDL